MGLLRFGITALLRTRDAVGALKGMVHPIPQRSLCNSLWTLLKGVHKVYSAGSISFNFLYVCNIMSKFHTHKKKKTNQKDKCVKVVMCQSCNLCSIFFAELNANDNAACIERLRELLANRPRSVIIVLRYLFAFLSQ